MRIAIVPILMIMTAISIKSQSDPKKLYSVFDSQGQKIETGDLIEKLTGVDVVFLGEFHDDSVGHAFQLEVLEKVYERFAKTRRILLSLEMFESDVQTVVDEYLQGLITEDHFLSSSRPWKNYKTDYRPMLEFAKSNGIPVTAANAPRRYVNMVSRGGRESLDVLSADAKKTFAPLPFGKSSEAYSAKFRELMEKMPAGANSPDHEKILESQTLWDATMAYRIAAALKARKNSLVVHINGSFHTEGRLGTPEHLQRYRKRVHFLVVTIRYEDDFLKFDPVRHSGLGDFVVLTDAKQPRSQR